MGDTVNAVLPLRESFAERLREGELALWEPLAGGGAALASVPDLSLLSPLSWPFLVLPLWLAPAVTKAVEMVVTGLFTALFLRRLGVHWFGGAVAAAAAMLTGFQIAWTGWPQTLVGAGVPVLFWAVERAMQEGRARAALPVALAVALMLVGGFPAVTGWTLLAVGVYTLARTARADGPLARRAGRLLLVTVMVALGAALAAIQLVPFARRLESLGGLGYRAQTPDDHLPLEVLATAVAPGVVGTPGGRDYFGSRNTIETMSFLGVGTVLLLLAAFVLGRRLRLPAGAAGALWGCLGVSLVLVYVGGPLLALAQDALPVLFGANFVGRLRFLVGFLAAVLAGIGADALARSRRPLRLTARGEWWRLVVGGTGLLTLTVIVLSRVLAGADRAGFPETPGPALVVPAVLCAALLAAVLGAVAHPRGAVLVLALFPVAFAVQAVPLAREHWPVVDPAELYPVTPAHRFLQGALGEQRVVSHHRALEPGATVHYGIRTVSAHVFHQRTWRDALVRVDPEAHRSPTFPQFTMPPEDPYRVAASPILDRLGASHYAVDPVEPLLGARPAVAPARGLVALSPGGERRNGPEVENPVTLRGVTVAVAGTVPADGPVVRLDVAVVDSEGRILVTGSRRLDQVASRLPGSLDVPVVETAVPAGSRIRVSVRGGDRPVVVRAGAPGEAWAAPLVATEDGLRVVHADGMVVYERLRALPRARWANSARVESDPKRRLDILAAGRLGDSTVLLSAAGTGAGGGAAGAVEVVREGDEIVLRSSSAGAGWVVLADAVQVGWRATVDGEPADLVEADHAGVAVHVPPGDHVVVLTLLPDGWLAGAALSALAVALVVLIALVPPRRPGAAIRGAVVDAVRSTRQGEGP